MPDSPPPNVVRPSAEGEAATPTPVRALIEEVLSELREIRRLLETVLDRQSAA